MAITAEARSSIIKLVVGMFGAAPGANILSALVAAYEAGATLQQLAGGLATKPQFTQLYPTFLTNQEFAERLANNMLGNEVTAAVKTSAVTYVVGRLNAGATRAQVIVEAITLIDNAPSTGNYANAGLAFDNKVDVATYYSVTKELSATNLTDLQDVINGVTSSAASVTTAKAEVDGEAQNANGKNFSLTVNQDTFDGTAGNDVFTAGAAQNGAGALINTLQSVDVIDGGDGADTINVTSAVKATTIAPTIKNIETVSARFADDTGDSVVSLANATGVTTVTVADSTITGTVSGLGSIANINVKNQSQNVGFTGSTATTLNLGVDTVGKATGLVTVDLGTAAAAKATTLNATLNNAHVKLDSTNADAVTTLSVAATGSNSLSLVDSGDDIKTVTVTGAGSLTLTATALTGALETFNAGAATGAIKVDIQSSVAATVTTGSGNDVVDMDTKVQANTTVSTGAGNDSVYVGAQLGNFKSVAGGEGTDIINITDGATWTKANAEKTSGFETLDVSGGKGDYDVSLVAFTTVQIDGAINGALAAAVKFTNVADTSTLRVASKAATDFTTGQDVTLVLADAAGTTAASTAESTTLNVVINDGNKDNAANGNVTITKYIASGVENVTINSTVASNDGGTTPVLNSAYVTKVTAVLDAVETLTLTGNSSITVALTSTTLAKVLGSGVTGNLTLDASGSKQQVAYTGAAGVDTYTATNGGSIYGGAGNDVITLTKAGAGGKADTIILKAAADVKFEDLNTDSKIDALTMESVTNFITAAGAVANTEEADVIDVTSFGFSGYARSAVNKGALANSVEGGAFATTITDFFADAAGDRGVAFGTNGGATYVFVDADKDGNWSSATDLAIKLVGVMDFANSSIAF